MVRLIQILTLGLRWLFYYICGYVLSGLFPAFLYAVFYVVIYPVGILWAYTKALWRAFDFYSGVDFDKAQIIFDIYESYEPSVSADFMTVLFAWYFFPAFLAGVVLANESLHHYSWKFWTWDEEVSLGRVLDNLVNRKFFPLFNTICWQINKELAAPIPHKNMNRYIDEAFGEEPENLTMAFGLSFNGGGDGWSFNSGYKKAEDRLHSFLIANYVSKGMFREGGEFYYEFNGEDAQRNLFDYLEVCRLKFLTVSFDTTTLCDVSETVITLNVHNKPNFLQKFLEQDGEKIWSASFLLSSVKRLIGTPYDFQVEVGDDVWHFEKGTKEPGRRW